MPSYEYECRACGYTFERNQSMSDEPEKTCPQCGKDVRRLIFGGSGVIFKGSGFYVNDAKGKKPAPKSTEADKKTAPADAPAAGAPAVNAVPAAAPDAAKTGAKESA